MRISYEFDQLRKKLNDHPAERLSYLETLKKKILSRDDFSVELAALYNFTGQYEKALELLENKNFHPWEGGEGQVLRQYTYSCLKLGQKALQDNEPQKALTYFEKSLDTPDNLGEKYHPLQAVAISITGKEWRIKALGNMERGQRLLSAKCKRRRRFC